MPGHEYSAKPIAQHGTAFGPARNTGMLRCNLRLTPFGDSNLMLPANAKPKESLQRLAILVEGQLRTVPVLHAAIDQDPSFTLRVGQPRRHDRDSHGRNWNI